MTRHLAIGVLQSRPFGRRLKGKLGCRGNRLRLICSLLVLLLSACGGPEYDTIPTYPVRGELSINGVLAKGAVVRLHPTASQEGAEFPLLPAGRADCEGKFRLTTYEADDGAPPGEYKLTIQWPDPDWRPADGGPPPPPPDRLKRAFADPGTSQWTIRINEGENELEPIRLEDVEILEGSSLPGSGD